MSCFCLLLFLSLNHNSIDRVFAYPVKFLSILPQPDEIIEEVLRQQLKAFYIVRRKYNLKQNFIHCCLIKDKAVSCKRIKLAQNFKGNVNKLKYLRLMWVVIVSSSIPD